MQSLTVLGFIIAKSVINQISTQANANCSIRSADQQLNEMNVVRSMMNTHIYCLRTFRNFVRSDWMAGNRLHLGDILGNLKS